MRIKLVSIIGLLVLLGCSNIQIERRAFNVAPPDNNGYSQISGRPQYRNLPPDEIQYEVVNASTKEKVSGKVKGNELLSQKIKAIEGDKIWITLKDGKGDYKYASFAVPAIPLQEKLVRMGYTKAEALEYMKYLAMIEYQQQQLKNQKRAAMVQAIGAILAAGAAQQRQQQNLLSQQYQPMQSNGPYIFQQTGPMTGNLINQGTSQISPVLIQR